MNQPEPQQRNVLRIRKFDMTSLQLGTSLYIFGWRNAGKTRLVRHILHHQPILPDVHIITGISYERDEYLDVCPNAVFYNTIPETILTRQHRPQTLIVDNSEIDYTRWSNAPAMQEFLINRRQSNIFFIQTQLSPRSSTHVLQRECDFVFIFRNQMHSTVRRIYELYGSFVPSYDLFYHILKGTTTDYCALVLLQYPEECDIPWLDRLRWCRSPTPSFV